MSFGNEETERWTALENENAALRAENAALRDQLRKTIAHMRESYWWETLNAEGDALLDPQAAAPPEGGE